MREYGSVSALCRKHKISRDTFYHRVKKGWTDEEALGLVERVHSWQAPDHAEISRLLREWKRP